MAQKLVILGAGESGCGSAVLAIAKGYDTFVSDFGIIKSNYKDELNNLGVQWESEKHTESKILAADIIIKSPGIADSTPIVKKVKAAGIKIISEIEFAAQHTNAKLIGITGTNGKTTTTLLTYHLLKNGGINVGLGGNVGQSFARQVAIGTQDCYVLELSSFQLDGMYETRIHQGVITNITPDHLDRYNYKVENYIESKFRITQNQTAADQFIYCDDDPILKTNLKINKGSGTAIAASNNNAINFFILFSYHQKIINLTAHSATLTPVLCIYSLWTDPVSAPSQTILWLSSYYSLPCMIWTGLPRFPHLPDLIEWQTNSFFALPQNHPQSYRYCRDY